MRKKINFIIFFIIFTINIYGKPQFLISIPESSKGLEATEEIKNMLKKSFDELGYEAEFVYLPDERSIRKVDAGEYDGEFLRIRKTIESYNNLVVVDEAIATIKMYAYTVNGAINNMSWEKLKEFRVITILGNKIAERNLRDKMNNGIFEQVKDYNMAFKMLENNRVDYVIMESIIDKGEREKIFFNKIKNLKRVEPYLIEADMYFSVNKKPRNISEKIANIIRETKKNR